MPTHHAPAVQSGFHDVRQHLSTGLCFRFFNQFMIQVHVSELRKVVDSQVDVDDAEPCASNALDLHRLNFPGERNSAIHATNHAKRRRTIDQDDLHPPAGQKNDPFYHRIRQDTKVFTLFKKERGRHPLQIECRRTALEDMHWLPAFRRLELHHCRGAVNPLYEHLVVGLPHIFWKARHLSQLPQCVHERFVLSRQFYCRRIPFVALHHNVNICGVQVLGRRPWRRLDARPDANRERLPSEVPYLTLLLRELLKPVFLLVVLGTDPIILVHLPCVPISRCHPLPHASSTREIRAAEQSHDSRVGSRLCAESGTVQGCSRA
mmetsp:Transcript_7950/g.18236  ORF Transcript_7950/g.18236 Transcript_7950/m.18236 type:complete len:320 (+) Transcript_7950:733-1692(+)